MLVRFADFPAGFADGLCTDLSLGLLGRLAAEAAFLTGFFLPAGAFFLAAAFFADMALASKTLQKEPAIIQTLRGRGRGPISAQLARQSDRGNRLPARLPLLGDDRRVDAAAHVELGRQADEARLHRLDEVVEYAVRDRLVKRTFVAVRPDVKLQRFQLDALGIGNVLEVQRREI